MTTRYPFKHTASRTSLCFKHLWDDSLNAINGGKQRLYGVVLYRTVSYAQKRYCVVSHSRAHALLTQPPSCLKQRCKSSLYMRHTKNHTIPHQEVWGPPGKTRPSMLVLVRSMELGACFSRHRVISGANWLFMGVGLNSLFDWWCHRFVEGSRGWGTKALQRKTDTGENIVWCVRSRLPYSGYSPLCSALLSEQKAARGEHSNKKWKPSICLAKQVCMHPKDTDHSIDTL